MRKYTIRVFIQSIDNGPAEHSEVHLGTVPAKSIESLVKAASELGSAFTKESDARTDSK